MKLRVYMIWELPVFVIHRLCSLVHEGFIWPAIDKGSCLGFQFYLMSIPIKPAQPHFFYCKIGNSFCQGNSRIHLLRCVAESNCSIRFCRPPHNRFVNAPCDLWCKGKVFLRYYQIFSLFFVSHRFFFAGLFLFLSNSFLILHPLHP